jgi:hypothetical protein
VRKHHLTVVWALILIVTAGTGLVGAQQPTKTLVPLEVEVVISRYQENKRLSSTPYTLAVNANGNEVALNMGTQVAVPTTSFTPAEKGQAATPLRSYNYRDVGTRISARATTTDEGRFDLQLNIDDSSVYTNPSPGLGGGEMPAFRSFSSRNSLLLRDGQMREYSAATDRVSGEVVKVSVTLRVVK